MPSASDYDQLGSVALSIKNVSWGAAVLTAKYGSGYFDTANVGPTRGLHRWKVTLQPLPDVSTTPLGTFGSGVPPFTYVYEFYKTHTVTEVPFILAWNGKTWTVRFSDLTLIEFEKFRGAIYSTGVEIEQVTIRSFTSYAADGSIAP